MLFLVIFIINIQILYSIKNLREKKHLECWQNECAFKNDLNQLWISSNWNVFFGKVYWKNIDIFVRDIYNVILGIFKPRFCFLKIPISVLLIMYEKGISLKNIKFSRFRTFNWNRNANVAIGKIPNSNGLVLYFYSLLLGS